MTTTVKVITHDWPVAVTTKDEVYGGKAVFATEHLEARSTRDYYLTSSRSLKLEELPKPERTDAPDGGVTDYAWLIEAGGNRSAPIYWDGGDWSADHLRAVRFRRKVDAERVMINIADAQRQSQMAAVEHGWITPKAEQPMAAEPAAAIPIMEGIA
jgi:hypothetical protein